MLDQILESIVSEASPQLRMVMDSKTIRKTENNFSVDGMIAPRLHNEGETNIYVLNTVVEPGQQFNFASNGFLPMNGSQQITIEKEAGKKGKAVIVFNKIIKKEC